MEDKLIIRGARENNLKNINIDIPKNKLVIMPISFSLYTTFPRS